MASLNRIILCGNLTRDPELSYLPDGTPLCKFGLAVSERVRTQQGEWVDRPCFVDISVFRGQAEPCNKFLHKGSPVLIEGKLRFESWEAKDGSKRSRHSVVGERVQFLSSRDEAGSSSATAPSRSAAPAPAAPAARAPSPPPPAAPSAGAGDEDPPF